MEKHEREGDEEYETERENEVDKKEEAAKVLDILEELEAESIAEKEKKERRRI